MLLASLLFVLDVVIPSTSWVFFFFFFKSLCPPRVRLVCRIFLCSRELNWLRFLILKSLVSFQVASFCQGLVFVFTAVTSDVVFLLQPAGLPFDGSKMFYLSGLSSESLGVAWTLKVSFFWVMMMAISSDKFTSGILTGSLFLLWNCFWL